MKSAPKIRVAFVTDIHVREQELDLHTRLLAALSDQILAFAPDLVLIGGDLAGLQVPHKATVGERNLLAAFIAGLAIDRDVVCVRGNHDFPGDYEFLKHFPGVMWHESPALCAVTTSSGVEVRVLALPWLDRSRFGDDDYSEAVQAAYEAMVKAKLPEMQRVASDGGVNFLLAHAACKGAFVREGQPDIPTSDPLIDTDALTASGVFSAGFLGHYHAPQAIGKVCCYGGSTFINEYGEDQNRGWLSWTTDGGFEHHAVTQSARVVMEREFGSAVFTRVAPGLPTPGSAVKIKTSVPSLTPMQDAWADAADAAAWVVSAHGVRAQDVKTVLDVAKVTSSRTGAAAVAAAITPTDKFDKWLATLEVKPDAAAIRQAKKIIASIEANLDGAKE